MQKACIIWSKKLSITQSMKRWLAIVIISHSYSIPTTRSRFMIMAAESLLTNIPKQENQHLRRYLLSCMPEENLKNQPTKSLVGCTGYEHLSSTLSQPNLKFGCTKMVFCTINAISAVSLKVISNHYEKRQNKGQAFVFGQIHRFLRRLSSRQQRSLPE